MQIFLMYYPGGMQAREACGARAMAGSVSREIDRVPRRAGAAAGAGARRAGAARGARQRYMAGRAGELGAAAAPAPLPPAQQPPASGDARGPPPAPQSGGAVAAAAPSAATAAVAPAGGGGAAGGGAPPAGAGETDRGGEPLLSADASRLVLLPIRYPSLWRLYKQMEANIWHAAEVGKELPQDLPDWEKLTADEQHFIKHVLAFFASSDSIVAENLALRFLGEVKRPEASFFYGLQIFNEQVHNETYNLLIDTYIKDDAEKTRLFNAIDNLPVVAKKAQWALNWISSSRSFAERLVAFACVEGIFFSGSFCAIFWLKKQGKMKALTLSNEWISRDEGLHCQFAVTLHSLLKQKTPPETIKAIVSEAVAIEREFVTEALPVKLLGMNAELMTQYIESQADRLLESLDCPPLYRAEQPFEWMQLMDLRGKSNFFERHVSEYQAASVLASADRAAAPAAAGPAPAPAPPGAAADVDF